MCELLGVSRITIRRALLELRKQIGWYLKGYPNSRPLREAFNHLETLPEVIQAARDWFSSMEREWDLLPLPAADLASVTG